MSFKGGSYSATAAADDEYYEEVDQGQVDEGDHDDLEGADNGDYYEDEEEVPAQPALQSASRARLGAAGQAAPRPPATSRLQGHARKASTATASADIFARLGPTK